MIKSRPVFLIAKQKARRLRNVNVRDVQYFARTTLENPLRLFIILASAFGFIMLFCMPSFLVPDEPVHFYRAYQVGEGTLVSTVQENKIGGIVTPVPSVSTQTIAEHRGANILDRVPAPSERFVEFPSSALYSPVPYIPQAIGIDIARLIYPSIDIMVFFGRLVNLAAFVALVALAIRLAPYGKWVYASAGLFPMAIQQSASLSTDVMTTGLAFVMIALTHRLFLQQTPLSLRQLGILACLAAGLGLTKQTNIVLLAPLIFLPKGLFGSSWKKYGAILGIAIIGCLAAVAWYVVAKLNYHDLELSSTLNLPGVNQVEQVKHLISQPLSFLPTLFRTYIWEGFTGISTADFYWVSLYGHFSWFAYKLPLTFVILGYISLLLVFLYDDIRAKKEKVSRVVKFLPLIQTGTFVLSMIGIATALYVVWTPVGDKQVAGIQGRYFIPLIPLLVPLFGFIRKYVKVSFAKPYYVGLLVAMVSSINASIMIVLTLRYFY